MIRLEEHCDRLRSVNLGSFPTQGDQKAWFDDNIGFLVDLAAKTGPLPTEVMFRCRKMWREAQAIYMALTSQIGDRIWFLRSIRPFTSVIGRVFGENPDVSTDIRRARHEAELNEIVAYVQSLASRFSDSTKALLPQLSLPQLGTQQFELLIDGIRDKIALLLRTKRGVYELPLSIEETGALRTLLSDSSVRRLYEAKSQRVINVVMLGYALSKMAFDVAGAASEMVAEVTGRHTLAMGTEAEKALTRTVETITGIADVTAAQRRYVEKLMSVLQPGPERQSCREEVAACQ